MLSPSSAPPETTDTEEMINPALIIRRAEAPAVTVSLFVVNRPMSRWGTVWHRMVPATMMPEASRRQTL